MFKFCCCVTLVMNCILARGQHLFYNITDFGAKADGHTVNTASINKAIQACSAGGGGIVLVPPGVFISGTIELFSNIELQLASGASLTGSNDTADYLLMKDTLFNEGYNRYGLIEANHATNISITGHGEINGNGTYFMNGLDKPHMGHDFDRQFTRQGQAFMKPGTVFEDGPVSYTFRPGLLITILNCTDVHIKDVTIKDAPEWTIRLGNCERAVVSGITIINNPLIPNNDGIHCTNSRNVIISDCNIYTGDDGIIVTGFEEESARTLDSTSFRYGNRSGISENITVNNCVITSRSAGIRIGYGEHPIRNLVFSNLILTACNRGIGIFARNGSHIEHVLFSNIIIQTHIPSGHWWGKGEPIHISAIRDKTNGAPGKIKDIRFVNISAESETGIVILGSMGSLIENISLHDVAITISKGKYTNEYGGNFDLRPAAVKDSAIFKHDIPGLFADYIQDMDINNLKLSWGMGLPSFFTHGIEISHYTGIRIQNSMIVPASNKYTALEVSKGKDITIDNCKNGKGVLKLKGGK